MLLSRKIIRKNCQDTFREVLERFRPMSSCQHGFMAGCSTLSNLLNCDSLVADLVNENEPFDIVSFDFKRAFDKMPHALLIEALNDLKLHRSSL